MTDEKKKLTKGTEEDEVVLSLGFNFDKLTDSEIERLRRAFDLLAPDDSFAGKPKHISDPRRARPM